MTTQPTLGMSHRDSETPGTGLGDVLDILSNTPRERLLSLTLEVGPSPEETVVLSLCLMVLRREQQALEALRTLPDNAIAQHLLQKWEPSSGGDLDLADHCVQFEAVSEASLTGLARVFRVLSERRLCTQHVRNLAYKRALSVDSLKPSQDLQYSPFIEEVQCVCGPELVEWLWPEPLLGPPTALGRRGRPLDAMMAASSLQTSLSLPTHLEVSISSATATKQEEESSETLSLNQAQDPPVDSWHRLSVLPVENDSKQNVRTATAASAGADPKVIADPPSTVQPAVNEEEEEEEEDVFYAFVIFHAEEDTEVAKSMRERLERLTRCDGATFGEFAVPGKSTLRCVEDAVNNSAFSFLLLTRNFNRRMLDLKTNAALINSINKEHKYNTVIPLLPRNNSMPWKSIPLVLQTIVPLEEDKSFEKKLQRFMSPGKIQRHRLKWREEQRNIRRRPSDRKQTLSLTEAELGWLPQQQQQPTSICIQNASYVMIGNDSQMTVGLGGATGEQRGT